MATELQIKNAKSVYKILCDALDAQKWHYDKHDEDLVVTFSVSGEDIPMEFVVKIDEERDLVRLLSKLPFDMADNQRVAGAVAINQINYCIVDGSFDYDILDGSIVFRMTSSYKDSLISIDMFLYMIHIACSTVDEYNDKLMMLSKGVIKLDSFFN